MPVQLPLLSRLRTPFVFERPDPVRSVKYSLFKPITEEYKFVEVALVVVAKLPIEPIKVKLFRVVELVTSNSPESFVLPTNNEFP